MMRKAILLLALGLSLTACGEPVSPPASTSPPLEAEASTTLQVSDAWASATPNGASVSAGYLTIVSPVTDRLVSVSTPRAARVEIHEMTMEGAVMRMRTLDDGLGLQAGQAATLAPGGLHLMFMDVSPAFSEGETIPVTLTFEQAGAIDVDMPVRRGSGQNGH